MSEIAPVISVIIPAYNAEKTICRSIDSALLENDINIEIVIINDCSSDSTENIIRNRYSEYKNVKLLNTRHNSGPSVARNVGIENATGNWVALLDADDWFARNRLSILHKKALEYDLDFIADSYYLCSPENPSPHSVCFSRFSKPDSVKMMTGSLFVRHGLGSVKPIIRKEFLDNTGIRFNPLVWRGEDMIFFVTMLINNASFGLLNTPLYYRQDTPSSLTKSDKVRLLMEMHEAFLGLQEKMNNADSCDDEVIRALYYRANVVKDALAVARWQTWIKDRDNGDCPGIGNLLKAARHLLFRGMRYPITKVRIPPEKKHSWGVSPN